MTTRLEQMLKDLEDIASLRLGRFAQAHEADQIATRVIQAGDVDTEDVVGVVEAWWNTHRQPTHGGPIQADLHCRVALVESIRYFSRGGS